MQSVSFGSCRLQNHVEEELLTAQYKRFREDLYKTFEQVWEKEITIIDKWPGLFFYELDRQVFYTLKDTKVEECIREVNNQEAELNRSAAVLHKKWVSHLSK